MAPTPEEVLELVENLSRKIAVRRPDIARHVSYYKGREGRMKFASDEFRDYFQRRFEGFSDNWCMPVAEAPIERIHHLGMRLPGERVPDATLARAWERNDADRGLSEALLMMTVAKRSFALVSPTPSGKARITFENPDSAVVVRDPVTRERSAGLVVWQDDKAEYAELHLPSSVLALRRDKTTVEQGERRVPPDVNGWRFDDKRAVERKNPLGAVGLVEFRNQALLDDDPISDIAGVEAMQDSINLVWAYLLNALDYASLPGRVVLNAEVPEVPILDKETGQKIGTRPVELDQLIKDRMLWVPGDKASISEWTAAQLDVFSKVIEHAVRHIAAQTRTPGHYLLAGENTPATGYELAEAGLTSKANQRIGFVRPEVREVYRLVALAEGDADLAQRVAEGTPLFAKTQYRSEVQMWDGLIKARQAGFPLQWIAEEYGLDPTEVERVMEMVRRESEDPYLARLSAKGAEDAGAEPAEVG